MDEFIIDDPDYSSNLREKKEEKEEKQEQLEKKRFSVGPHDYEEDYEEEKKKDYDSFEIMSKQTDEEPQAEEEPETYEEERIPRRYDDIPLNIPKRTEETQREYDDIPINIPKRTEEIPRRYDDIPLNIPKRAEETQRRYDDIPLNIPKRTEEIPRRTFTQEMPIRREMSKINKRRKETFVEQRIERTTTDDEIEEFLARQQASIKVIGCGGGGNNTIDRIKMVGIDNVEIIAANTDAQDLLFTNADKKILLGKQSTKGLGAGANPKVGEQAARESEQEIKEALQGADLVFITCGLGGGTGTGAAPVIAEVAKKVGCLTVAVVTLPFSMEGNKRFQNAINGLEKLESVVDTMIIIPNDKLLEIAPDLPLNTAFKVSDEILTNAVKGIADMVTRAGLVNLDFADVRAVMGNGGVAVIGVGESDSENRATDSVQKAINNPLLDVDITGANGALINVAGGTDMTLDEARKVVEAVSEKLSPDATIIWGAQIYEDLQNTIRVMMIITGVKSSQIFGKMKTFSNARKEAMGSELGIDFID